MPDTSEKIVEVMVEGQNAARGQVMGRTTQNKTLNFTTGSPILPAAGSYMKVRHYWKFPEQSSR